MEALEAAALEFDHDRIVQLAGRDPPTKSDMQRISELIDEKEELVRKSIALRQGLTTEQLHDVYLQVSSSRN
jgi:hypothetical protein